MAEEGIKGNLVSVNWLEQNLNRTDVLILDASPAQMYAKEHIPGAINVDLFTYGGKEVPLSEIEQRFQSWGISPGKKIVIYDRGKPMMATRLFFDLYYNGFTAKDLFILDGGFTKWQESGKRVTNEPTSIPKKGSFRITKMNEDARAKLPEFLTASGDQKNNVLLEALEANWHFGELQFFDRPGHIPHGILLPSGDFLNPDKTFKSAEEIKKILNYFGVNKEQKVYTYCGGGIAASVPFFALKFILDFPDVKLFSESELGWLQDVRELPFWTYDAPYLIRETNWLKTWGGRMMRMYGVSQVSIIDVRSADAFNMGHIPFALNISSDLFKNNINNPEKLAEVLGQAGINASYEAVVVSGNGLNEHSALAFLMLEYLGQKKVSVFMDSNEKFAQSGTALTKEVTAVGSKKAPQDLSIPPTTYPLNFREGVIITDSKTTQGLYPKVFIASGKIMPNKVPDGKIVHIPYTDLLNTDGTPKAAKDIWNILVKAGVPRYAELVCFSDDPGEAAVNYFILKLMGYPDIKVLVI
jgi:3-mercaptopyruvate sulfurtransferase SseA